MEIPLILKLRKAKHKEIAKAQDILVEEIYNKFNDAVLHGGTAIWRCYHGNRFSEDVDVYLERNLEKIDELFDALERRGFLIKKKKVSENAVFSILEINKYLVRFEALFKKVKGILADYETVEGNLITVLTLSPEALILEKIKAYSKRRKIRDLYDIFYLLKYADIKKIERELKEFLMNFKKPINENQLQALIIYGLVPTTEKMIEYIKRKVKWEK